SYNARGRDLESRRSTRWSSRCGALRRFVPASTSAAAIRRRSVPARGCSREPEAHHRPGSTDAYLTTGTRWTHHARLPGATTDRPRPGSVGQAAAANPTAMDSLSAAPRRLAAAFRAAARPHVLFVRIQSLAAAVPDRRSPVAAQP